MAYHPKPPPVRAEPVGVCEETCTALRNDLGTMSDIELNEWRQNLIAQRDATTQAGTPTRRDIGDFEAFQREINCVTKWRSQCEPVMAKCDKQCDELKKDFQSGTDQPLPKRARDYIANEAIEIVDNRTKSRNEVVEAQKRLNCLLEYEDCLK